VGLDDHDEKVELLVTLYRSLSVDGLQPTTKAAVDNLVETWLNPQTDSRLREPFKMRISEGAGKEPDFNISSLQKRLASNLETQAGHPNPNLNPNPNWRLASNLETQAGHVSTRNFVLLMLDALPQNTGGFKQAVRALGGEVTSSDDGNAVTSPQRRSYGSGNSREDNNLQGSWEGGRGSLKWRREHLLQDYEDRSKKMSPNAGPSPQSLKRPGEATLKVSFFLTLNISL